MNAETDGPVVLESNAGWFLQTLGVGGLVIALTALIAFILTLVVVLHGKRSIAGPALLFIVPLPMLVSIFGVLKGMIASFRVITTTDV